ncbi:MAG: hypothetical protein KDD76_06730, partial [Rickettsiales bacterium]|nr:hypothetical protein [Rickettsiales bacterium]
MNLRFAMPVIILSLWLWSFIVPSPAYPEDIRLFGSHETRSTSLKSFPKWTGALARYQNSTVLAGKCSAPTFN